MVTFIKSFMNVNIDHINGYEMGKLARAVMENVNVNDPQDMYGFISSHLHKQFGVPFRGNYEKGQIARAVAIKVIRIKHEEKLKTYDNCSSCQFWNGIYVQPIWDRPGETVSVHPLCRRFPKHEERRDEDWCGEHKKKNAVESGG